MPYFDGYEAVVVREPGTINVYYGGRGCVPDGEGHGHVKAQGGVFGESIVYWRLPECEGGKVVIDNFEGIGRISDHLTGNW